MPKLIFTHPVAEKTYRALRSTAMENSQIRFVAISHSDEPSTAHWIEALGNPERVEIVVDPEREIYAAWGLGVSSFWHVLSPSSLYSVYRLGKEDGIWNKPTESGTRWQTSGCFAVDENGIVRWSRPAKSADDAPDFGEAVQTLGTGVGK